MLSLSYSPSLVSIKNRAIPRIDAPRYHQTGAFCRISAPPQLSKEHRQRLTSLNYNPLRECRAMVMNKKRRGGYGAVCYTSPITPGNLLWISAVSTAVLMLAKGTAIHKPFLVPLFVLQAPSTIVAWMKGEYGIWTAFLALLVRLFFAIPGELELPLLTFLLVILSPYQITNLRGTKEGAILSLVISGYLAFQHFSRAGGFRRAFDQGSIVATIATIFIVSVPCLLLI